LGCWWGTCAANGPAGGGVYRHRRQSRHAALESLVGVAGPNLVVPSRGVAAKFTGVSKLLNLLSQRSVENGSTGTNSGQVLGVFGTLKKIIYILLIFK